MRYEITGKNGFTPTQANRDYIEKKLEKVVNFFGPEIILEVRVVCKVYNAYHKVEVTIPAKKIVLRAEVSDKDMYAAVDLVVDKLISQIKKHRDKIESQLKRDGLNKIYSNEFDAQKLEKELIAKQIVKNKSIKIDAIDVSEAIANMELSGHDFYVFLDINTSKTCVVYKREDGDYAVIETQ